MSEKYDKTFRCEHCDHSWDRKYDFYQHLKTKKHMKNTKQKKTEKHNFEKPEKHEKIIVTNLCCNKCQFTCTTKKEAKQHATNNHKENNNFEIMKTYTCVKCDKCYDKYVSCWKHTKTCQGKTYNIVIENTVVPTKICIPIKKEKLIRKTIPLALKRIVWNKYIGEEIGKTQCLCCKLTDISQMNFSCGHIVSVHNGGCVNPENLKPICSSCNSSMGTQNMDEFIQIYGL